MRPRRLRRLVAALCFGIVLAGTGAGFVAAPVQQETVR